MAGRGTNYFATYNWTEEWTMGGQMSFWHRPLHATTDAFTKAGSGSRSSASHNRMRCGRA